jgi:transcriptional regulator with XRE-family HTH domain
MWGMTAMALTATSEAKRLAEDMGQRLRWVREALGLSTTQLAAHLNLDEATIRHFEKVRRSPSIAFIATLCHLLRITPQYLFYGDVEGIDPELRATLVRQHPELQWPSLSRPAGKWSNLDKSTLRVSRRELAD